MNDRKIKELEGKIAVLEKALLELSENSLKLARYVDRLADVVNGLIEREAVKQKGARDDNTQRTAAIK